MFTWLFVSVLALQQAPPQPRPTPCTASEFRHFDFWVGSWSVTDANGTALGANVIEPFAGGCGLQETWSSASGGDGRSLNMYDAIAGEWKQVWVGSDGTLLRLAGGLREGSMVLAGETVDAAGKKTLQRISWTPLPDGRVVQRWDTSADDGATWVRAFEGFYVRRRP